jgi:hypothetical protein
MAVNIGAIIKNGSHARSAAGSGFRRVSINAHGSALGAMARGGANPSVTGQIFLKKYFRRNRHKITVVI